MQNDLTIIMGASSAPARALTARIVADTTRRVVLVDRDDPMRALLAERAPMLSHHAPSLGEESWQSLMNVERVTGAAIDRDVVAWTVAMMGLLRPTALVLCVAEHEAEQSPTHHATALSDLTSTLSMSLTAINQYYQLLVRQQSPQPRLVVVISGTLGTATDAAVARIVDALACELLSHAHVPPHVLLVPRLIGPGCNADHDFHRMLRQLLLGDTIRFASHDPNASGAVPRWLPTTSVATLVDTILRHAADSTLTARALNTPIMQGRRTQLIEQRGHPADLAYLGLLIADELDRLMPDVYPRRSSLVRAPSELPRLSESPSELAETIRFAVRWFAANASLLTNSAH